jgi:hypothetical protein
VILWGGHSKGSVRKFPQKSACLGVTLGERVRTDQGESADRLRPRIGETEMTNTLRNFITGMGFAIMAAAMFASYTTTSGKLTAYMTGATPTVVASQPATPGS